MADRLGLLPWHMDDLTPAELELTLGYLEQLAKTAAKHATEERRRRRRGARG